MAKKMFSTEPDVFGPFRLAFPALFEKRAATDDAKEKYSVMMLFPKDGTNLCPEANGYFKGETALRKLAYDALISQWGSDRSKWPGTFRALFGGDNWKSQFQQYLSPTGKDGWPFRDGDAVGDKYDGFSGHVYIRAATDRQPPVRDANVRPILDQEQVFGGLICFAQLNAYTYDTGGSPGVTFGLNMVQVLKDDGVCFQGRANPDDVFSSYNGLSAPASRTEDPQGFTGPAGEGDPFGQNSVSNNVHKQYEEATGAGPAHNPDDDIPF